MIAMNQNSEVDMKDFQDHTIDPFPLYIKEKHCVEIIHLGSTKDIRQHVKEKQPSIEIFCHQLTDVIREGKGEVDQQPTSAFHSPMLSTNIQPYVSSVKQRRLSVINLVGFITYFMTLWGSTWSFIFSMC
jgi:hypothetical protein